ncbi:MAG: DUF58 domain-containing protein [Nitrospirae bacterium]|nr:DUF58 domain-containing protein [Nitrospirota bacterium]
MSAGTTTKQFFQTIFYYIYRRYNAHAIRMQFRLTDTGKFIFASIIISGALGIDTQLTMAFVVFTLLFSIFFISIFYVIRFNINIEVSRIISPYAAALTPFNYKVQIISYSERDQSGLELIDMPSDPRPSLNEFLTAREPQESKRNIYDRTLAFYRWAWLIDKKNHGIKPKVIEIPTLYTNKSVEIQINIIPESRGVFSFKEIIICKSDPIGLFRAFHKIPLAESIYILPRQYPIPLVHLDETRKYNLGGVTSALSVGDSMEFYAIRDYIYGDSIRHIDWKGWAKTDKPVIKEYHEEYFSRHGLALDTFGDSDYVDAFEGAVTVAASLILAIKSQETLIDFMFVEDVVHSITVGRGLAHKINVMELLSVVTLNETNSIDLLSQSLIEKIRILSGIVLIFIKWDKERKELVDYLRSAGIPVKVFYIKRSSDELKINSSGITLIELEDINSGLKDVI